MQKGPFGAEAEVRDLILFEAKPLAGEADRHKAVERLLRECVYFLHAFELNGTRSWHEDAASIELGRASARPVISGGDRHACEQAGCLNLTDVRLF